MRRRKPWPIAVWCAAALICSGRAAAALMAGLNTDPAAACLPAITAAERAHLTPPGLLEAIGLVESGRRNPLDGRMAPWPWTIDVDGEGHVYSTEAQAIAAVQQFRAAGHTSIDVGCMQINLQQHPDAFANLEMAFDPRSNADYAATFLRGLHDAAGDWLIAAGRYHSLTLAIAAPYRARVMAMLQTQGGDSSVAYLAPPPLFAPGVSPFGGGRFLLHSAPLREQAGMGASGSGRALAAYRASPIAIARRASRAG